MTRQSRLLCVIVFAVLMSGCGSCGMCANDEVQRVPNQDGTLDAVLFQRDCGATTGFSTQISVVPAKQALPDDSGNAFVADDDHGKAPAAKWGGPPASITWRDAHTLVVRYHPDSRVFQSPASIDVSLGWFDKKTIALIFEKDH